MEEGNLVREEEKRRKKSDNRKAGRIQVFAADVWLSIHGPTTAIFGRFMTYLNCDNYLGLYFGES